MTENHGRVIITWPPASGPVLLGWGLVVHDADTGEQITDATSLSMTLGSPNNWDGGPVTVTLTRLVDADGQPIGRGVNSLVRTDEYEAWHRSAATGEVFEGQHFRVGTFTYLVAEMRMTPADPTIPTRESVNRGEHTVNQYRAHHGIADNEESSDAMTWSLNASGHTPTPDGAHDWAEVEKELHAELQNVLSNPKYGATHSHFSGNHVQAPMHLPAEPAALEDEAEQGEEAPTHHQHHGS